MTEKHSEIQAFLGKNAPVPLYQGSMDETTFVKAGIVPFINGGGKRRYMSLKPVPKRLELGRPEFQLCKGTRMCFDGSRWLDIRGNIPATTLEPLAATALREGIEELGLRPSNIETLYELGPFNFTSATSGKTKTSWMFAASIKRADDFMPLSAIAQTTAAREFFDLASFKKEGRPDFAHMLEQIDYMLGEAL